MNKTAYIFDRHTFRKAMVTRRRGFGLTKKQAAKEANIEYSTYYRIENGKEPSLESTMRLCTWLNISPTQFITKSL